MEPGRLSFEEETMERRTKRLQVKLSSDEHKKLKIVSDHVGVGLSDYVRPLLMSAVEREIEERSLRPALPHRSPFAPASAQERK
jgi:hypothetical protein